MCEGGREGGRREREEGKGGGGRRGEKRQRAIGREKGVWGVNEHD